jgi:hypothetical protein
MSMTGMQKSDTVIGAGFTLLLLTVTVDTAAVDETLTVTVEAASVGAVVDAVGCKEFTRLMTGTPERSAVAVAAAAPLTDVTTIQTQMNIKGTI